MISLENVCAGYRSREILHSVCAQFPAGKVTALIGPNGCGKSTLLKTVVQILHPTSGRVLIDGIPSDELSPAALARRVAYLPQSRPVPDITVFRMVLHGRFSHLSYPRRYREEDYAAASRALRSVGMEQLASESLASLSGGMRQKVYIAAALAQDSAAVLMDEPTTHLDIAHQLLTLQTARDLAAMGRAVVLVLHDLAHALCTADNVVLLAEGRVVFSGSSYDAYASGKLDEVFGVRVERVVTESGAHYVCSLAGG